MATSDSGSSKNKIWLAVVGIVVLAGVAYVADIYPPADESLTGSIVPAERYRAETSATASSRLVLGDDALAQFIQTDVYRKIVSDRDLAALFANREFREAFANKEFREAFANQAFRDAAMTSAK